MKLHLSKKIERSGSHPRFADRAVPVGFVHSKRCADKYSLRHLNRKAKARVSARAMRMERIGRWSERCEAQTLCKKNAPIRYEPLRAPSCFHIVALDHVTVLLVAWSQNFQRSLLLAKIM